MRTTLLELPTLADPPPLGSEGIEQAIKSEALRLGFAFCGITTADPPPHHSQYQQWLSDGCAGSMQYLERQEPKRGDLDQVLPGAESVVVVGLNYTPPAPVAPSSSSARGVIARYARFDDYHAILWGRLEGLLAYIQQLRPEAVGKVYCDTGPITERDLAMRAGIGFIGKHTGLINRRLGNWFFLGEIILAGVSLAPDTPETPHCGTCSRCIPACPTGAITAPYRLDARRCISYLTIELKGSIPAELRPLIGNRIYGCDDCLAACPWNRFATVSDDPAVQPRDDLTAPDLVELLTLTDEQFRERFARSPIKRAKRRGLLRNVCVALGNIGDMSAVPALERARDHDREPLVCEHAAWAVTQILERESSTGRTTLQLEI